MTIPAGLWPELSDLLDQAMALAQQDRAAWLAERAGDRPDLAPHLRRLLAAHERPEASDPLQTRPAELMAEALAQRSPERAAGDGLDRPMAPLDEGGMTLKERQVGPYRLLREIGEGGMATVWLAERADGLLARRIALKLPHLGWGRAALAGRIARERALLASLTHPSIARLYDAGIADDGRPYLALEFVDGQAIDTYAAKRGLSTAARVELIVQVARAVAYAHHQLIIHRDLKPSNILVDGEGRVRLLDFGVAKLIDPGDADSQGDVTVAGGRALTPQYASPEQVRGDVVGTASDVYSLGIVAHELFTGTRPYHLPTGLGLTALAAALDAVERRPASELAQDEGVQRKLRGDLDAILSRALALDPGARYATADAFAEDLERHLRGEPVRARAASRAYLAERWIRRHKLETAIVAALIIGAAAHAYAQVLVSIAIGAGAIAALWQRNRAVRQAEIAQAALARGEQVKDFIASIFTQAVPRAGKGGVVAAVDLLRAAAHRVEVDLTGQPAVAAELGALIGASFNELNEVQAAMAWLPRAIELCTRALGPMHRLTLQSRYRLAEATNYLGDAQAAIATLLPLIRDLRALLLAGDGRRDEIKLLACALENLAIAYGANGRELEATSALNEGLELAEHRLGEDSDEALSLRVALSNTLIHFGRKAEALAAMGSALEIARTAYGAQRPHRMLLSVERAQANAMASNNRPGDAAVLLRQALADERALDVDDTPRVREAMTFLGKALLLSGCLDEAAALFAEATALLIRLTGGTNQETAGAHTWQGRTALMQGDGPAALHYLGQALALAATLPEDNASLRRNRECLRCWALALAGHADEALTAADALATVVAPLGQNALRLQLARAQALRRMARAEQARHACALALAAAEGGECPAIEHGLSLLEAARERFAAGDESAAAVHWNEAIAVWKGGQVESASWQTSQFGCSKVTEL